MERLKALVVCVCYRDGVTALSNLIYTFESTYASEKEINYISDKLKESYKYDSVVIVNMIPLS